MSMVERLRAIDSMEEAWFAMEEAADTIEELEEALKASRCALHGALLRRADAVLAKIGGDA